MFHYLTQYGLWSMTSLLMDKILELMDEMLLNVCKKNIRKCFLHKSILCLWDILGLLMDGI